MPSHHLHPWFSMFGRERTALVGRQVHLGWPSDRRAGEPEDQQVHQVPHARGATAVGSEPGCAMGEAHLHAAYG